ncbi:MAG: hypothetical protein F4Y00_00845 [Bacteroidetes bacterium SB0662_bin_6]|nr:hypothetical protein [Bacteroidetes bacterium SB0662_bin_6]
MPLPRSLFDEANQEHLVLPDVIRITQLQVGAVEQYSQITFNAMLSTDPSSLQQFEAARPIVLQALQYTIEEPNDHRVHSFDAVKQSAAQYAVVITCALASQENLVALITTEPAFLSPEYRANTEEFLSMVQIASAVLSRDDIGHINVPPDIEAHGNLAQFVLRLYDYISRSPFANHKESELTNLVLDKYVDIERCTNKTANNAVWNASFSISNSLKVSLSEARERVEFVVGTPKHLHVLFEE